MALGIGMSARATARNVAQAIKAVLVEAGWDWDEVDVLATRSRLAADRRLAALGKPVAGFDDDQLSAVRTPTPSGAALAWLSIPAVAEAAALLAAHPGGHLVVPKRTGTYVTVAAARTAT